MNQKSRDQKSTFKLEGEGEGEGEGAGKGEGEGACMGTRN